MQDLDMKKLRTAYNQQTRNCYGRLDSAGNPIQMKLTFDEWLQIWIDSGKLHLRRWGKGSFVMSRKNDLGHYEVGNVFIQSNADNTRDALAGKKRPVEIGAKIAAIQKGKKRPAEVGANISAAKKGKKQSAEHSAKIAAANRGKKRTAEFSAKLSAALRGKKRTDEQRAAASKPCTVDGVTIYPSLRALVAALGSGKAGYRSPNFRYIEKKSD